MGTDLLERLLGVKDSGEMGGDSCGEVRLCASAFVV